MKDTLKYFKFISTLLCFGALCLSLVACSEMDDTYDEFLNGGMIIYPGKADSVKVYSGRDRLNLEWLASTDPKVKKAIVYWDNKNNSVEVPLEGYAPGKDTVTVQFTDMPEGSYVFEIYTFDADGNRSVKVEALGQSYGSRYEQRLLSRPINTTKLEGDVLNVEWGSVPDFTAIGSEVFYTAIDGSERELYIPASDPISLFPEFTPQTFKHRTLYLPDSTALDTFHTAFSYQKVKGPPVPLDKSNWSIIASSEDVKGNRLAANLIDGNLTNLFVNELNTGLSYPHWVEIDMGEKVQDVEGFMFYQRNLNPLKTLSIEISDDGETWESLGVFIIDRKASVSGEPVILQLDVPVSFRHVRQTYIDDYGGSANVNIHEMDIYIRN